MIAPKYPEVCHYTEAAARQTIKSETMSISLGPTLLFPDKGSMNGPSGKYSMNGKRKWEKPFKARMGNTYRPGLFIQQVPCLSDPEEKHTAPRDTRKLGLGLRATVQHEGTPSLQGRSGERKGAAEITATTPVPTVTVENEAVSCDKHFKCTACPISSHNNRVRQALLLFFLFYK